MTKKYLLAIETSCDDTSIALVSGDITQKQFQVNFFESFSQEFMLREWGGVVPELAARNHIEKIFPLIKKALLETKISAKELHAIAVTQGPGLLGPLLTGINTAKSFSLLYHLPLIGVNHLLAHLEAIHFDQTVEYPYLGVVISGGHTFFAVVENKNQWHLLGSTVDDALGEALDKGGKMLGLTYPAGKLLDTMAPWGNSSQYFFPKGMIDNKESCAVSYSGIKNALRLLIEEHPEIKKNKPQQFEKNLPQHQIYYDVVSSYMNACYDTLLHKIPIAYSLGKKTCSAFNINSPIVFGGGVAMSNVLKSKMQKLHANAFFVSPTLCTDNALMIATLAWRSLTQQLAYPKSLELDAFSRFVDRKTQTWIEPHGL